MFRHIRLIHACRLLANHAVSASSRKFRLMDLDIGAGFLPCRDRLQPLQWTGSSHVIERTGNVFRPNCYRTVYKTALNEIWKNIVVYLLCNRTSDAGSFSGWSKCETLLIVIFELPKKTFSWSNTSTLTVPLKFKILKRQ